MFRGALLNIYLFFCSQLDNVGSRLAAVLVSDDTVNLAQMAPFSHGHGISPAFEAGHSKGLAAIVAVVPLMQEILALGFHSEREFLSDGCIHAFRLFGNDGAVGVTAGRAYAVFVVVVTVEDVQFIVIGAVPHDHIDCDCTIWTFFRKIIVLFVCYNKVADHQDNFQLYHSSLCCADGTLWS